MSTRRFGCTDCGTPVYNAGSRCTSCRSRCTRGREQMDRSWAQRAECPTYDPDLFFPVGQPTAETWAEARAVCAVCPVRAECLADAAADEGTLSHHSRAGMWGGLMPRERASAARREARERAQRARA